MNVHNTAETTLPLPADVKTIFLTTKDDHETAANWLAGIEMDATRLKHAGHIACIQSGLVWTPERGAYEFHIYDDQHVGPKGNFQLALPIMEDGNFVDLLLIDCEDLTATTACGTAAWLGRDQLSNPSVRLHASPIDWLEAGCNGVCHIAPISRRSLSELRSVRIIKCNDVHTALEAWDWGFEGDEEELGRFIIDAEPTDISLYFDRHARWAAVAALKESDFWPRREWKA